MSQAVFNLRNFLAYQIAWFAVVLGAARGLAWAGAAVAIAATSWHLWQRRDALEWKLLGLCAGIGLLVDSSLALTGQVQFADAWPENLAPYWMLSLWVVFATTLNHSLRWLMHRPVSAALFGAAGGPLAYYAGQKLGALTIATPAITLPVMALLWSVAMLALSMIVMRASLMPAQGSQPA